MCLKPILSSSFSILSFFQSENPPERPHIATLIWPIKYINLDSLISFPNFLNRYSYIVQHMLKDSGVLKKYVDLLYTKGTKCLDKQICLNEGTASH